MPYIIVPNAAQCPASRPFGVFTETSQGSGKPQGEPHGCFPTKAAARKQQAALYVNAPDETNSAPEVPMSTTEPQVRLPHLVAYRQKKRPRRGETERIEAVPDAMELRTSDYRTLDVDGEEKRLLQFDGYASVFDRSYRVGPYTETISRGAFKRSLGNPNLDVALKLEHDGPPLARTTGREQLADGTEVPTLRLNEDDMGLRVHALLDPDDPDVKRLVPKYRRGDLKEMSFAFRVGKGGDEWSDDYSQRTIHAADLHRGDVSIVTYGASPTTTSLLRSEELADELRSVGPEGLVATLQDFAFAWVANHMAVRGKNATLEALEARVGKVLSSDSMITLQQVLQLSSDIGDAVDEASDAVDEAQALLADLMGVPNPAADEEEEDGGPVTEAPQLDHVGGRSEDGDAERRNDPTAADYGINCDLKQVKMAIAQAKADQLQDPDGDGDADDAAVMAALEAADAAIDQALVAQGKDVQSENGDGSGMMLYAEGNEDLYWRKTFTADEREKLAKSGAAMPDGSFPIETVADLRNAIQAVGRASNPAAAKAHIKKRARALGATDLLPDDWRSADPPERLSLDEAELTLRAFGRR